jgi:hypothetical protein
LAFAISPRQLSRKAWGETVSRLEAPATGAAFAEKAGTRTNVTTDAYNRFRTATTSTLIIGETLEIRKGLRDETDEGPAG